MGKRGWVAAVALLGALAAGCSEDVDEGDLQFVYAGTWEGSACNHALTLTLEQNWSRLTYQSRMYIYASLRDAKDLKLVFVLWRQLVDAIEQRDAGEARTAVRGLVRRTLSDLGLDMSL